MAYHLSCPAQGCDAEVEAHQEDAVVRQAQDHYEQAHPGEHVEEQAIRAAIEEE